MLRERGSGLASVTFPMTRAEIADALRGRIMRGLHAGTAKTGDRLPSARELREEFGGVDHRIILDAYRELEREGLIELRARGGTYVSARPSPGAVPLPSANWLVDVFAQSIAREIPIAELHQWMRGAVSTLRIHAVAIQSTADQIAGLVRELRDDYGLCVTGINVAALRSNGNALAHLQRAHLLVTTPGCQSDVRPVAERLNKKLIVVDIRPDLIGGEWRLLLKRPVYVILSDDASIEVLHKFFANTPGAEHLRPMVVGRDSLESIPEGAAVYVTRSARDQLGTTRIRGRLLPAARLFSAESSRAIIRFIVEANLHALASGKLTPE